MIPTPGVPGSFVPVRVEVDGHRLLFDFPYNAALKDDLKMSMEGAKWEPESAYSRGHWSARDCPRNWFILEHVWKNSPTYRRFFETPPVIGSRYPLWPNQVQALSALLHKRRLLYAGKQGTGKMLIGFAAADHVLALMNAKHQDFDCWWVCSEAGQRAYDDERATWTKRGFQPAFYPSIRCTYSSLPKVIENARRPPNLLVLDECAAVKTTSALQTQAALGLVEMMEREYGDDSRVLALSGTPQTKAYDDWWSQAEIVRAGWLREGNIYRFRERYAILEERLATTKEDPNSILGSMSDEAHQLADSIGLDGKPASVDGRVGSPELVKRKKYKVVTAWKCGQTIETIKTDENGMTYPAVIQLEDECGKLPKRLAGICMRHDERDLPINIFQKRYHKIELKVSRRDLQAAKTIADTAPNAAVAITKMMEISDGFYYETDEQTGQRSVQTVTSPKEAALVQHALTKHRANGRILIYAGFTESLNKLTELACSHGWNVIRVDGRGWQAFGSVPAEVGAFQDKANYPQPVAFIAHPKSGGEAITLDAADSIHYYSNTYHAKDRWQSEMRLRYRDCDVYDYLYLPSDERCLQNLLNKEDASKLTLDELRVIYEKAAAVAEMADAERRTVAPLPE